MTGCGRFVVSESYSGVGGGFPTAGAGSLVSRRSAMQTHNQILRNPPYTAHVVACFERCDGPETFLELRRVPDNLQGRKPSGSRADNADGLWFVTGPRRLECCILTEAK